MLETHLYKIRPMTAKLPQAKSQKTFEFKLSNRLETLEEENNNIAS